MSVQTRSRSPLKTKSGKSEDIPSVMISIATGTSSKERRGEKRYSEYESGHQPKAKRRYTQSSSGTHAKERRGQKRAQGYSLGHQSTANGYLTRSTHHVSEEQMNQEDNWNSQSNILPSTKYLSKLFYSHDREKKFSTIKAGCQKISNEIFKVKNVVDVYPAYTTGGTKRFVFVVTVKKETEDTMILLKALGYDIEIKSLECHHTGGKTSTDDFLTKQEFTDTLKGAIRMNAKNLMMKHRYLCFVRGCKYTLENNDSNECKYEPRMALYVRAKGLIPIDEKPFEKMYDGVHVDVREGVCISLAGHPDEVHENVRMGCQIQRHIGQTGSLGVFFEHDEYGICGLTCGHVVLSLPEMKTCLKNGGTVYLPNNTKVYQPTPSNTIGTLKKVVCKEGNDKEAGLEIALIQLTDRKPINGKFPIGRMRQLDIEFESGSAFEPKIEGESCFKFGCITEYTRGIVVSSTDDPNYAKVDLRYEKDDPLTTYMPINNQLLVKTPGTQFAARGDSGSPVFIKASNGKLVCIGIVECCVEEENCDPVILVTPITQILHELGISKLKSFSAIDKMAKDIGDLKRSVSIIEQLVTQQRQCVCS